MTNNAMRSAARFALAAAVALACSAEVFAYAGHKMVDGATWHWAEASSEPLIVQGPPPRPHRVLIELADPTHELIDSQTAEFTAPHAQSHH